MSSEVGAYEAKTHLAALLERVERGEQITITKHGRPVARLVPVGKSDAERRRAAVDGLRDFAKGRILGVPVRQLIEEGRR